MRMVKKSITNKLICLFVMFSLLQSNVLFAGRCSGSSNCGACSSCNYCGYCNSGGSCGFVEAIALQVLVNFYLLVF